MNDRTARWVVCLALVPLAAPLWWLSGEYSSSILNGREIEAANVGITAVNFILIALIWRKYVNWRRRCVGWTSALWGAALLQAALGFPLWSVSGCGMREAQLTAQSLTFDGVVLLASFSIWWWANLSPASYGFNRNSPMSANSVRMTLSLACVPLVCGLFWLIWSFVRTFMPSLNDTYTLMISYWGSAMVFVIAWVGIWRSQVRWTPSRVRWTVIWCVVLMLSPFCTLLQLVTPPSSLQWANEVVSVLGPLLVVGFYLIAIAFLWRDEQVYVARGMEINGEPLAVCPQCSYSLRGLREVRCPECGWSATVDEFLSNVIRQAADVS